MNAPRPHNNPVDFEQQLATSNTQYELLTPLNTPVCRLRFTGPFNGNLVIWDAQLQTLAYYVREHGLQAQDVKQFIEVGNDSERGKAINIALNLPLIDQPALLKTIIMIRQYKLLAPGRHEFGKPVKIAI